MHLDDSDIIALFNKVVKSYELSNRPEQREVRRRSLRERHRAVRNRVNQLDLGVASSSVSTIYFARLSQGLRRAISVMRRLDSTALISPSSRAAAMSRLKQALDIYVHHRPTVQRILTAGFVLYCLGTTYQNLSGKGAKGGAREKVSRKVKAGGGGESPSLALYGNEGDHGITLAEKRWSGC